MQKRTTKRFVTTYDIDSDYNGNLDYLYSYGYSLGGQRCLINNRLQMLCIDGVVEPCFCSDRDCTVRIKNHLKLFTLYYSSVKLRMLVTMKFVLLIVIVMAILMSASVPQSVSMMPYLIIVLKTTVPMCITLITIPMLVMHRVSYYY